MAKTKEKGFESLDDFLKGMNTEFGANTIVKIGDIERPKIIMHPTGVTSIDKALGGGFAEGRIAELFGMESSGKSSISLLTIAEAQKKGLNCAIIDTEQAIDFEYAELLGVDVDKLVVSQPDCAEDALELLDRMIESELFSIIVFDSVAAMSPRAELEGEMGDAKIGVVARLMSQALRKITAKANKTKTTVIFINQLREKIGGMTYVPTKVTSGGNALKFFCSQRVEIIKGTKLKKGEEIIGNNVIVKVIKNKVYPPFKTAEVENIYGKGIDKNRDKINIAVNYGIIKKAGSWFSFDGSNIGQGIDKVVEALADNPELEELIDERLKEFL